MPWHPKFGSWLEEDGTHFRLWAPKADSIEVAVFENNDVSGLHTLQKGDNGIFTGTFREIQPGTRFKYRINGGDIFPDPASRFQPEGVHGPSQVIDSSVYSWQDKDWQGCDFDRLVIYELHIGTFSPLGTYQGVIEKLPELVDLGITAIELMPLADFPGQRNWGYDGVSLFAPARCYGDPEELRRLVDEAHQLGLAVLLDVVYNHIGPDGNYLGVYTPYFDSQLHKSPWGACMNFDGEQSHLVREYFIDNALYWLHSFHFDGLRLDATHAIIDTGKRHFLAQLTSTVREQKFSRPIHLIAEDHRNMPRMMQPEQDNGWGLDGVWADDFHHQTRRILAGDNEGYYQGFSDSTKELAEIVTKGWFYCGQYSASLQEPRGSDPSALSPSSFIICIQNHDQIGNRAFGERLNHQVDLSAYRAASALLLCSPQTPLLFMGQEWAASSPFLFFTDHNEELGKLVTAGRRKEFGQFATFNDPTVQAKIPDPQAEETFRSSCLNWAECQTKLHEKTRRLYRTLLHLRKSDAVLQSKSRADYDCFPIGPDAVVLERRAEGAETLLLVCRLRGFGSVDLAHSAGCFARGRNWQVVLTTEDEEFTEVAKPPVIGMKDEAPLLYFFRPCAVLFREVKETHPRG